MGEMEVGWKRENWKGGAGKGFDGLITVFHNDQQLKTPIFDF